MDLKQLRYFTVVATERSFRRASEKLHMAQPPLSRQVQQLEEELGVILIDRKAKPIELTPAGRLLYEQAIQVLDRVVDIRKMVEKLNSSNRPRFVIGYVASTIYARLPDLIRRFRKIAPRVDLSLVEMMSIDQIRALKEGRIDVGFGRVRLEDPVIRRIVLREERLVVALPLAHPLGKKKTPLKLRALGAETIIVYPRQPRPSYADQVLSFFRDQGIEPVSIREASELQSAVGLVAAEEGICLVPESIAYMRQHDVRYRPLSDRHASSPIIMSYRPDTALPELALLSQVLGEMYAEWGYPIPDELNELVGNRGKPI